MQGPPPPPHYLVVGSFTYVYYTTLPTTPATCCSLLHTTTLLIPTCSDTVYTYGTVTCIVVLHYVTCDSTYLPTITWDTDTYGGYHYHHYVHMVGYLIRLLLSTCGLPVLIIRYVTTFSYGYNTYVRYGSTVRFWRSDAVRTLPREEADLICYHVRYRFVDGFTFYTCSPFSTYSSTWITG